MRIKLKVPAGVKSVLIKIIESGYEISLVGGMVRDTILNRENDDWDFATNATPEQLLEVLGENAFYNNKYGTVGYTLTELSRPLQITTYRSDHGYSDSRRPDEVRWGTSLKDDLSRRDFTINALAVPMKFEDMKLNTKSYDFEVIDEYGGVEDVRDGIIKCVGDANDRFSEDALRMMRAVRIAAQLGFAIEEETFEAIQKLSVKIEHISWERIRDEIFKLVSSTYASDGYLLLRNTGLGKYVLPEMEDTFGVEQKSPGRHHKYDVGTHSVMSLKYCPSLDPVTRLATLIHDVGKVKTYRKYPDGRITFYNHEMESAKIAEIVADRFKFSKKDKDKFVRLVRWHQFTVSENQTDSAIRRFITNVGMENIEDMLALRTGDRLGGGASETSWRLEDFKKRIKLVQTKPFSVTDLKINGNDVIGIKKIESGKKVGEYLNLIFYEVQECNLENDREILLKRLEELNI